MSRKVSKMNILFTSVGRRSYLVKYFKEVLGDKGSVHVMNSSSHSPAFLVADKVAVSPLIYEDNYIPFLLKYCTENSIDAIISLFDIDLPVLALHKDKFEQIGTRVIVSDYELVRICNDKWKTFLYLKENGFLVPRTYISIEDAKEEISAGNLDYPVIIKPRWGMGSISIYEADNEEELTILFEKTKRNIINSYLKYESKENMESCVIIQEKLKGQEYGLDVINDLNGKHMSTIVKMKYAMRSGETDCAITVHDEDAEKLGKQLSNLTHHIANLDVDIFVQDDKRYVLEMNARFGGGYPFSHMSGVNLPLAIIKWLNEEEVDEKILIPKLGVMSQKDIKMVCLNGEESCESN